MRLPQLGPVIAIDGPAGTGKSSATHRLAEVLGFVHVDTGALYRAIAFLGLKHPETDIGKLAYAVDLKFLRMADKNPMNRIFADDQDLTEKIRTPEVTLMASKVSMNPHVRAALFGLQRTLGCAGSTILEGRDIGTIIFPEADVKFFLCASLNERAKRRLIELELMGADTLSFETVKAQIFQRDQEDSHRVIAPLRKAADAIEIDTSAMTLDQVVHTMEKRVRNQLRLFL